MNRFDMSDINKGDSIHFIGIGGISMSGLAQIAIKDGYKVTGSDWNKTAITDKLAEMGADIAYGVGAVNAEGIEAASVVVYTAAAKSDNPEMQLASKLSKRIIDRAEFLGAVMKRYHHAVGVAGTHGKTTTTSMLAHALIGAGIDPTISIGGELDLIGGNIKTGADDYFVTEACEYTNSFLKFYPTIALITNIEEDHLDFFTGIEMIKESFRSFAYLTEGKGYVVAMNDDANVRDALKDAQGLNIVTYGMAENSDYYPENISYHDGFPSFDVMSGGKKLCALSLSVPGEHNILNAVAAIAVCVLSGVDTEKAAKGLESFKGTHRRFETKGFLNGAVVIDDYAHHPTEIKATLSAAKKFEHNKIWCVFQPHTYSRTKTLWKEFTEAFDDADELILTYIYAAREKDDGVTKPENLAEDIKKRGMSVRYIGEFDAIADFLKENVRKGDIVFTMGAGNVVNINDLILN